MNAKAIVSGICTAVWLGGLASAQPAFVAADPPPAAQPEAIAKPVDSPIPAVTEAAALPAGSVCSPWTGPGGTGCCGPVGGHGPIVSEVFLRQGINFPVAGGILNNVVGPGYALSAGARSLFFNPAGSAAWTIEYGLDYIYNNGRKDYEEFDLFGTFVNIRETHRAAFRLAGGREWYLYAPAYQPGKNFRVGTDVGGRYGFIRANFNLIAEDPANAPVPIDFGRRSDTYGGVFVAFHSDMIVPMNGCLSFVAGLRAEWSYNFSDVIPTWDSDLQDVNLMFNFGFKF
ncbi:MAG: hypothetical protein K1X57_19910 [Gemmataceae bacterium]|nr:hypothetical protein [Gemmataceae bacterium]